MKRKLAGILMCMLPLVGCNDDVQKPDVVLKQKTSPIIVQTTKGSVEVKNVDRNNERKETSASVVGAGFNATLQIVPAGDGVVTVGGNAMLIDASGRLLYSLAITINQETNEVTYRQATEDDFLVMSVAEADERVRESYDANGDRATFDYPQIAEEVKSRTLNQIEHGLPTTHLPEGAREYGAQAEAYGAYYLPHVNSTLKDNAAGELLIQLLSSPDVSYAMIGDQPEQMNKYLQTMCNLITACSTFACRRFPSSAVCSFCMGGALACAIFQSFGPWFPLP